MDITTHITGNDSVAKTRTPKQCRYRHFHLKMTNLLAMSITLKDDDKPIVCPTHKQGSIIYKCQCIYGIAVLGEGLL